MSTSPLANPVRFAFRDHTAKSLRGKVTHLYHSSEQFSAGILCTSGAELDNDVRFSVRGQLAANDEVILHGAWEKHNTYGWQFTAKLMEWPMPDMSIAGLATYLAGNPAFRGVGPIKAAMIADTCGADFDRILREEPERLVGSKLLTAEQVDALKEEWCLKSDMNAIGTWLAAFGLTHCQIKRIAERYGNRAKQVLEENPYILCDELNGFGFSRTDEVALKMGVAKDHPGRISACLMDLIKDEAETGGHTYTTRAGLLKTAIAKLCFDTLAAEQIIREQLAALIADGGIIEQTHDGTPLLSPATLWQQETDLLRWFAESAANPPERTSQQIDERLTQLFASAPVPPTQSQTEAILSSLRNRVAVLSGGAGTGKSFTVAAIYKLFQSEGKAVGLAAPTGKAARRMSQLADGAEASTIHRLLGYNPTSGWTYGPDNKLPQDLIIIDEVSMCDISLLHRLFEAINLQRSCVLLVGDHNQLPPIGAGNALRDILAGGLLPCSILDHCHRAAGELKSNANALLEGKINPTTAVLPAGGREWRVIDELENPDLVIESLRMLMRGRFAVWGFHAVEDCQIITPYNKGALGVNRINAELQRVWQSTHYGVELPDIPTEGEPRVRILAGDKVMQIKNDYKLGGGVMNGTQGVVVKIGPMLASKNANAQALAIQFDDRDDGDLVEVEIGSDAAANIVLAYACTIHKVQGSEYPCVVAIIHKSHAFMLSRNLIYTAATRARKTAILIGDKLGMRRAARNVKPIERRTWMSLASQEIRDNKVTTAVGS
jgi:exodeoxyribonuclease V alpha subunit